MRGFKDETNAEIMAAAKKQGSIEDVIGRFKGKTIDEIIADAKKQGSNEEAIRELYEASEAIRAEKNAMINELNIKKETSPNFLGEVEVENNPEIRKINIVLMNVVRAKERIEQSNKETTSDGEGKKHKGHNTNGAIKKVNTGHRKKTRRPPRPTTFAEKNKEKESGNYRKSEAIKKLKIIGITIWETVKSVGKKGKNIIDSIKYFVEGLLSESKSGLASKNARQLIERKRSKNSRRTQDSAKSEVDLTSNISKSDLQWLYSIKYRGEEPRNLTDDEKKELAKKASSIVERAKKEGIAIINNDGERRPLSKIYEELVNRIKLRRSTDQVSKTANRNLRKSGHAGRKTEFAVK